MKILIADDDPVSRRLVERMLQKNGYEVVTADNGTTALEILCGENAPRMALLDWMMPQLDGVEVCRRIRGRHGQPYIYITLLTSKLSNGDVVAGLEAGSDDYLTKPCNPDELMARLRAGQRVLRLEDTLVQARDAMHFRATHDTLTGLWNQGAVLELVRSELSRCAEKQIPQSVLLCDIDRFKQVNDGHGHLVGDEVLRQVAVRLGRAVRPLDVVGRYGGEEFLILLRGCARAYLEERAEQVRETVARDQFRTDAGPLAVTISVGALTIDPGDIALPLEVLLKRVDSALYRAKFAGRNRVVCADPGSEDRSCDLTPGTLQTRDLLRARQKRPVAISA